MSETVPFTGREIGEWGPDPLGTLAKRVKTLEDLVIIIQGQTGGMMDQIADQKAQIALLVELLRLELRKPGERP